MTILIVGAGPAGLTLAIELARRGVAHRLVDAATDHFPGSRGKGLQPRTLEVFADLGVLDEVLATGSPYPSIRSYRQGAVVWEGRMAPERQASPDVPYPNVWLLPQHLTERVLRRRLAELGGRVELGTALVDLAQDAGGVSATLRRADGDERARFDYVVGADGGHSTVRRTLGIGLLGETRDTQRLIVADVPVADLDRQHWHMWGTSPADSVGLCPLAGTEDEHGGLFQFQAALLAGEAVEPTAATVREVFARRSDSGLRLGEPTWVSVWRANIRLAERFRDGRVFLAGDAAHVHSPTGGQGLNTSVQDSYNLGWKLAAVLAGAPDSLLDTYQAERLPVAAHVLGISTDILDRSVRGEPDAHRRDDPELDQLSVSYRNGPLAYDERTAVADPAGRSASGVPADPAKPTCPADPADPADPAAPGAPANPAGPAGLVGLVAGDRAPDAPYRTAAGRPARLFDLYATVGPTVLAFGAAPELPVPVHRVTSEPVPGALHDADGHIRAAYPVADGTLVVIRPDGYVGAIGTDPTRIVRYLGETGTTPVAAGAAGRR